MRIIYAKWVKEQLEDRYNIFPIGTIANPNDPHLKAWVYNKTKQLSFALDQIMEGKQNGNDEE